MKTICVISRSEETPAPSPLKNKIVSNELKIINTSKFLIITQALIGVNRLYLLQYNKFVIICSVFYSFLVYCGILAFFLDHKHTSTTISAIKYTKHVECSLFILAPLFLNKKRNKTFFQNLSKFDEMLNIQDNLDITSPAKYVVIWTLITILLNMFDEAFGLLSFNELKYKGRMIPYFILNLSHDMEYVYCFTLLRSIYLRLVILKAHVKKMYVLTACNKLNKVETMCEKVRFDVSSLHRVYELLHDCSEQLNSIMNFTMFTLFFTSWMVTIMMLKKLVNSFQILGSEMPSVAVFLILYRCLKYTVFLVIPCYYSSVTVGQTTIIRKILHDAASNMTLDKTERRKVKTFYHLTRESDFGYAICGVIKLDMSLPLSYMSLCTTYLVIVIQFSKFID